jgi:hypothetical protein
MYVITRSDGYILAAINKSTTIPHRWNAGWINVPEYAKHFKTVEEARAVIAKHREEMLKWCQVKDPVLAVKRIVMILEDIAE